MYLEKDLRQLKYTMQKNHMHKHMSKCLDKYAAKRILTQRMLKGGSDLEKLLLGSEF